MTSPRDDDPPPLACSLAPESQRQRQAAFGALVARALIDVAPLSGGVRARFAAEPGLEQELRALIALEAECCAFLAIALHATDRGLLLDVTGPPEAQAIIDGMFSPTPGLSPGG